MIGVGPSPFDAAGKGMSGDSGHRNLSWERRWDRRSSAATRSKGPSQQADSLSPRHTHYVSLPTVLRDPEIVPLLPLF